LFSEGHKLPIKSLGPPERTATNVPGAAAAVKDFERLARADAATTLPAMVTIYGPTDDPEPLAPVSDLAGTPVVDVEEEAIGAVFGALAEVDSGLIRYLDVALDHAPKHVLVPIGHARVDRADAGARVRLRAATQQDLAAVPTYQPEEDGVDEPFEREVLNAMGRLFYGERYYAHPAYDHSGLYAGEHPIARTDGDEEAVPGTGGLVALRRLTGYRVADGVPDVRGWTVTAGDGTEVGRIEDLIVDVKAETVRYVEIAREGDEQAALLPVGYVRLDKRRKAADLPVLTPRDVDDLRFHDPDAPVLRETEDRIKDVLEELLSGSRRFDRADFKNA